VITITFLCTVKAPFHLVKANFGRTLFEALAPVFPRLKIDRYDGDAPGSIISLRLGLAPIWQKWVSIIESRIESETHYQFIDVGHLLPFPLYTWRHTHTVTELTAQETEIADTMNFSCKPAWLEAVMRPVLIAQFSGREPKYKAFFKGLAAKNN
jgi:ligand-binding SRPBCC domain-containing protein